VDCYGEQNIINFTSLRLFDDYDKFQELGFSFFLVFSVGELFLQKE
jgi:hypothetical protein